ncbi:hypothetical protein N7532_005212 [Penicillium argentinense]|uniref:Uncharacterized protein n=1 Tax=Penicillium argentinense TaxID=1131581 RepID=A0A9W9FDH5_9EURO|nr:uncharacterized protein N7532_005212 [Penicillium argentinense]KAJ5098211.1 hypothetical protein N7532_005212 [Penicillium argentinense]
MPRILPWTRAQDDDRSAERDSPSLKRVKRESSFSDQTHAERPASPKAKREYLKSSPSPPYATKRDSPVESLAEVSKYKEHLKDGVLDDTKPFDRPSNHAVYKTPGDDTDRPTDGRTPTSKEIQLKGKSEALSARQSTGLEQINAEDAKKSTGNGSNYDDDNFRGTHLYHLMTTPKKSRSLLNVHGIEIKSSTRAAAGFGPPAAFVIGPNRASNSAAGASTAPPPERKSQVLTGDLTQSSDEDDLDGPIHRAPTSTFTKAIERPEPRIYQESPRPRERIPENNMQKKNKSTNKSTSEKRKPSPNRQSGKTTVGFKSKMQSLFDDLDELPESSRLNTSISDTKDHSPAGQAADRGSAENNLESKKSRSHNVPTFLV